MTRVVLLAAGPHHLRLLPGLRVASHLVGRLLLLHMMLLQLVLLQELLLLHRRTWLLPLLLLHWLGALDLPCSYTITGPVPTITERGLLLSRRNRIPLALGVAGCLG